MAKKLFLVFFISLQFLSAYSQDKNYKIFGTVKTKDGVFKDAYIAVNGFKHYMDTLGNYEVKMPFQQDNILVFGRKGSVQQTIEFSTVVSKERIEEAFYPKEINIVLFDKVIGVDLSLMEEPIEKYAYSEDNYDFDNDEAYALDMRTKVETLIAALEQAKKSGTVSAELTEKAKKDAEQQKAIQEQAKKDALEKLRIEKEKQAAEIEKQKKEEALLDAEEAARRKAEREKRKKEDDEFERQALRLSYEQDSIEQAQKQIARKEAEEKRLAELKKSAIQDSILKVAKNRALKEAEEKRLAEAKAKEELALSAKLAKEKTMQEAEEKRLAEAKAKEEELERIKKEKEEQAKQLAQALKDKEAEDAKNKALEMQALKEKLKVSNLDAENKRLEQLAAQEELYKKRQSNFKPVMGIYTTTTSVIAGKKAYGYINFGNGLGNQDLTKEEFDAYKEKFKK